ncbi:MAG: hypothetical protein D6679_03440 [Candidatus Hydrogenedentota bacterium]|nr:MAG: hypothetical protein D6679_03440 [Candidatus Hydrogenedentota bacterium]
MCVMRKKGFIPLAAVFFLFDSLLGSCASVPGTAGGETPWRRLVYSEASTRDLAFLERATLWATDRGIFRSDYRKRNRFQRVKMNVPGDRDVLALGARRNQARVFAVTDLGNLLLSENLGRSFQVIGRFPNIRVYDMALSEEGRLYVATSAGLLEAHFLDTHPVSTRTVFMPWETLALALPIWRRVSEGSDTDFWKDWSVILPGTCIRLTLDPDDNRRMIADVFRKGSYLSTDGGETWEKMEWDGVPLSGPAAFGSNGWVVVGRYFSRDDGRTWRRFPPIPPSPEAAWTGEEPPFPDQGVVINADGVWCLDYLSSSVYRTRDGKHWEHVGRRSHFHSRGREAGASLIAKDLRGRIWVGTDGHGLFVYEKPGVEKF